MLIYSLNIKLEEEFHDWSGTSASSERRVGKNKSQTETGVFCTRFTNAAQGRDGRKSHGGSCSLLFMCYMQSSEVLNLLKRGNHSMIQITPLPRNTLPKATARVLHLFSFKNKQIHIPGNSWSKFPRQPSEIRGEGPSPPPWCGAHSTAGQSKHAGTFSSEQTVPALCLLHTRIASKLQYPPALVSPIPNLLAPATPGAPKQGAFSPRTPQSRSGCASAGGAHPHGSSPVWPYGPLPKLLCWPLPWKHYCRVFIC